LADRQIDRREFVRYACLLGMSATAAYGLAGLPAPARAQAQMPKGGTLRIGTRCFEISTPAIWQNVIRSNVGRQVFDYLVHTGADNVTRPSLAEKWEASPDLKTWTFTLRKDVKWHNGQQLTADHVIWNLKRLLDPATGSSVLGQFRSFLMKDEETGEKDDKGNMKKRSVLWDASAIQKKDDFTIVLNGQVPRVTVPEDMFHYQLAILHPDDKGQFKPGALGTGAFTLVEDEVGRRQVVRAKPGWWGGGPYLDAIEFIDVGDDPAASLSVLASQQVHGLYRGNITILEAVQKLPNYQIYSVDTGDTAVARMKPIKPFDDKRVRLAMRLATDTKQVADVSLRSMGSAGEHHHVAVVHPDYAKLPFLGRDTAKAKALLAEAGYPNGIDIEFAVNNQYDWQVRAAEFMVEQWKEVGIRCKIKLMPPDLYFENWKKHQFGLTVWAHRPLGVMTLGLAYRTGAVWNESDFSNAEFDRLLTQAEGILDVGKRKEVMAKIEQIMLDEGPIVLPAWAKVFTFMDKKVQGYRMHPTGYIFGHELAMAS
ncbi:MAG: ABC transporter substrate-binding protein, partial [Proteobacteria bacterium]|nr:ABC transporter substrate-binding protein [Pseudomonadota bacterium]